MTEHQFKLQNLIVKPEKIGVRTFSNISISFNLDFDLPKHSSLIIRFRGGRNNKNDWYILQPFESNQNGFVEIITNQSTHTIPMLITGKQLAVRFLIDDKVGIIKNTKILFNFFNTLPQSLIEKRKPIEIYIELPNRVILSALNNPKISVVPTDLDHFSLICPSIVGVHEIFPIIIRAEDKFYNLVDNFEGQLKLFISRNLVESHLLDEIHFPKESKGIYRGQEISFSGSGNYVIECEYNSHKYRSNPIICKDGEVEKRLFWGFIHGHTDRSDGIRSVDEYFENLHDAGLDFGTTTEHDHSWETKDEDFEYIKELVQRENQNDKFVSFFGYEWGYWYTGYGDICIYYNDIDIPIFRSDVKKYNTTKKLIRNLKNYEENVLMIAHHSALRSGYRNWDYFDNSIEKLVEIYSTWGNQEYSVRNGNPLPPRYKFYGYGENARKRGVVLERKESFVKDALKRGYKLGFTAGGDDHYGVYPSGPLDPDNGIYPPGIMAIWAENLSKESIWAALHKRQCYGTTGPRIIIDFSINKHSMGSIIDVRENIEYESNRKIQFTILSPTVIEKIEIIRNNDVFKTIKPNSKSTEQSIKDLENFDKLALLHINKQEIFVFYYLRVFLENENMAWSSPVWFIKS